MHFASCFQPSDLLVSCFKNRFGIWLKKHNKMYDNLDLFPPLIFTIVLMGFLWTNSKDCFLRPSGDGGPYLA